MIDGKDVLSDLLPDEFIGSQILSTLLARYNLILTRSGEEELSIAPSNVAMASYSPSNFLLPTMAVNNILLGMGLHLEQARDGSFDVLPLPFLRGPGGSAELSLPGDESYTKVMDMDY
ncbi:MAG: hypothetical protein KAQ96_10280 [Thermoplasmata archaeon]|nr:hypothetical protein [Thermoplasmata archaeon]